MSRMGQCLLSHLLEWIHNLVAAHEAAAEPPKQKNAAIRGYKDPKLRRPGMYLRVCLQIAEELSKMNRQPILIFELL